MNTHTIPFKDFPLNTAPLPLLARVAAYLHSAFGVTLTRQTAVSESLGLQGAIFSLKHEASGAWLQKDSALTFLGALRAAAHMHRAINEPRETAELPRFGRRQNRR